MAVDSAVFEATCEELEARTSLDKLEVRGTVRIALKAAGLEVRSVDAEQMVVVLRRVLPSELESRGISEAAAVCDGVVSAVEEISGDGTADRAAGAAAAMSRFGS
jgi:hypothetical protein